MARRRRLKRLRLRRLELRRLELRRLRLRGLRPRPWLKSVLPTKVKMTTKARSDPRKMRRKTTAMMTLTRSIASAAIKAKDVLSVQYQRRGVRDTT